MCDECDLTASLLADLSDLSDYSAPIISYSSLKLEI